MCSLQELGNGSCSSLLLQGMTYCGAKTEEDLLQMIGGAFDVASSPSKYRNRSGINGVYANPPFFLHYSISSYAYVFCYITPDETPETILDLLKKVGFTEATPLLYARKTTHNCQLLSISAAELSEKVEKVYETQPPAIDYDVWSRRTD